MADCPQIRARNMRCSPVEDLIEEEEVASQGSPVAEETSRIASGLEHGAQNVGMVEQADYTNAVSLVPAALKTSFMEMLTKNDAMPELSAISLALAWQKGDYKTAPSQL